MKIFALPDLGEGLQDAEVVAWHVAEGDHVVADQPLASVETEKAVVEVPAPWSGHIKRLCAGLHERIKVGAPLVEFEDAAHADEGAIVGHLPESSSRPRPGPAKKGGAAQAAPAVRALARTLNVDLALVAGSGPGGAILAADVEGAAKAGRPTLAGSGGAPLSATRRAMADNMARAHREVVPATVMGDADVEAWPDATVVTARLVRAVVRAAAAVPALNAWYDGRRQTLERRAEVDVAVAVDTDAGLIVPVLAGAQRRTAAELQSELRRLTEAARNRTLTPAELRGGSITVSNFGSLGGRYGALVVVPPQVAIVGAGRIERRPVAIGGSIGVHRLLPLSLTFDHRAVTGGEAARFLAALAADLETAD
jgi:pyruvate dehydrogenase E2 component (dihydrolipoamide acetyltransferase)